MINAWADRYAQSQTVRRFRRLQYSRLVGSTKTWPQQEENTPADYAIK